MAARKRRILYHEIECFGQRALPRTALVRDEARTLTPDEAKKKAEISGSFEGASVFRYIGTEEHPISWKPRVFQTVVP